MVSLSIPCPESETITTTLLFLFLASTSNSPPSGMASLALVNKFKNTWLRSEWLPFINRFSPKSNLISIFLSNTFSMIPYVLVITSDKSTSMSWSSPPFLEKCNRLLIKSTPFSTESWMLFAVSRISVFSPCTISRYSIFPEIACNIFLKLCAVPPAKVPIDSIFWETRSCSCRIFCSASAFFFPVTSS